MMPRLFMLLLMLLLVACRNADEDFSTPTATVPPLDAEQRELAVVLAAIVKPDGVDYSALKAAQSALDRYRAQLAQTTMPVERASKLALFINAYNACTLALVSAKLPAEPASWKDWSITKAGTTSTDPWKLYTFVVAGQRYTLDQMENEVLRPLGEPRIHFAINCASRSCPTLSATPYVAATIETQLESASKTFARSAYHVRLEGNKLLVNPIMDWFAEDFAAVGGVRKFLGAHADPEVSRQLSGGAEITYFTYDWSLNLAAGH